MKFSCRASDGRCVCASKGQTRVPRLFLQAEMGGGGIREMPAGPICGQADGIKDRATALSDRQRCDPHQSIKRSFHLSSPLVLCDCRRAFSL